MLSTEVVTAWSLAVAPLADDSQALDAGGGGGGCSGPPVAGGGTGGGRLCGVGGGGALPPLGGGGGRPSHGVAQTYGSPISQFASSAHKKSDKHPQRLKA